MRAVEPEPSVQSESNGRKCFCKEADLELFLKTLVPYLDNPSEEAIFERSQIKEQHDTVKRPN